MRRAIALSARALDHPGSEPFGAVVVRDGAIVGEGFNRAAAHHDPTAHGEIEAIRDACRRLRCTDLAGCELYTSCEPCALCAAAMAIAGIGTFHYAASLDQSERALAALPAGLRPAITPAAIRAAAATPGRDRASQMLDAEAVAVLERWAARAGSGPGA
nr:nucleoside deaminase [Roseomonas acroporae]